MAEDVVIVAFPPGTGLAMNLRCVPAGKRRCTVWLDREFLGHTIARVDGTWASKSPGQQTSPGCADRDAALLQLLELRARVCGLIRKLDATELDKVGGGMRGLAMVPTTWWNTSPSVLAC